MLSTFTISLNSSIMQNQITLTQSETISEAIALSQRYIEEAESKQFDEDRTATIPSSFTSVGSLGPDANETYTTFDDLDDYNGYTTTDNVSGYVPLTVNIIVDYVTLASPTIPSASRTYFKRMAVSITSPALSTLPNSTLTMNRLFAYHYFFTD